MYLLPGDYCEQQLRILQERLWSLHDAPPARALPAPPLVSYHQSPTRDYYPEAISVSPARSRCRHCGEEAIPGDQVCYQCNG